MKPFGDSFYLGPDLSEGALPILFYFALSAEESLAIDPYNQPAMFLTQFPVRIFSFDLPGHGPGLPAIEALQLWAKDIASGFNVIKHFVQKVKQVIHELKAHHLLIPEKLSVAGLSRGAFIASHVAAEIPEIRSILGFAPLTHLTFAKEFGELKENPLAESLNLSHLIPALIGRPLRFYIGNHDIRVGTARCFHFISSLSEASFQDKIRSPQVELIIKPSIGQYGHGTAKEVFHDGAQWIAKQWGLMA